MKLKYIDNACVVVECSGKRVLCDPWLSDGIYYGSWFHYPPLTVSAKDFADVDYIYISHIHPDHFDPVTLAEMSKDIPILILDFADKFVLHGLQNLGFKVIYEVGHGQKFTLAPGFTIEILAADNCDPEICGRFFNCSIPEPYTKTKQIDSLAVFQGEDGVLVNTNDCPYPLAKSVCAHILNEYGHVDLLLVGYRSAGPFPQCFDNFTPEEKAAAAIKQRDQRMAHGLDYIRHLRPSTFLPFAGQYILGGKLSHLNQYLLPNIEDLQSLYLPLLEKDQRMIMLNSLSTYDLKTQVASSPFIPPSTGARKKYIEEVLSQKKFVYEDDSPVIENEHLLEKLNWALDKLRAHRKFFQFESEWTIYLDTGSSSYYRIPFASGEEERVNRVHPSDAVSPYLKVRVDPRLLVRILDRKAHWNNAEIGSHLGFFREPNEFNRTIHFLMSYFHC